VCDVVGSDSNSKIVQADFCLQMYCFKQALFNKNMVNYCRTFVSNVHLSGLSTGQTAELSDLLLSIIFVREIIYLCLRRQYLPRNMKEPISSMLA